jgi:tripartite-type tricarboxylate transporter receptor subunit TctC
VNYMFDSITSARNHIQSGKLRALAVTTAKRSKSLPNVPTMAEAGVAGYDVSPWFAVFAPAGTPAPIIAKLNKVLTDTMKQPEVIERLDAIGAEPVGSTPEALASHLARESAMWTKLITERGIKLD